ncbi:MAG: hypothetical protein ACP5KW_09180 [Thermoproteota archaeon]
MSLPLITPEEVLKRIRANQPTDRIVEPERRFTPSTILANERLFGIPVFAFGEGYKGQYLRHSYYDATPTERVWQIELGYVTIYGERKGIAYPLFANGFPTSYVFAFPPDEFEGFYAEPIRALDVIEVKESQIINLDRVTQLKDSILIVDRFDLLKATASRKLPEGVVMAIKTLLKEPFITLLGEDERKYLEYLLRMNAGITLPSDIIDQLVEKNRIIESMQRAIWEYQRRIVDYETNMNVYRSENTKFYELVSDYAHNFSRISTELTNLQKEMIRLRDELAISMKEAQSLEEAKKKLLNAVDIANALADELNKLSITAKTTADTTLQMTSSFNEMLRRQKEIEFMEAEKALEKRAKKVEAKPEEKKAGVTVKKKEAEESE